MCDLAAQAASFLGTTVRGGKLAGGVKSYHVIPTFFFLFPLGKTRQLPSWLILFFLGGNSLA